MALVSIPNTAEHDIERLRAFMDTMGLPELTGLSDGQIVSAALIAFRVLVFTAGTNVSTISTLMVGMNIAAGVIDREAVMPSIERTQDVIVNGIRGITR